MSSALTVQLRRVYMCLLQLLLFTRCKAQWSPWIGGGGGDNHYVIQGSGFVTSVCVRFDSHYVIAIKVNAFSGGGDSPYCGGSGGSSTTSQCWTISADALCITKGPAKEVVARINIGLQLENDSTFRLSAAMKKKKYSVIASWTPMGSPNHVINCIHTRGSASSSIDYPVQRGRCIITIVDHGLSNCEADRHYNWPSPPLTTAPTGFRTSSTYSDLFFVA